MQKPPRRPAGPQWPQQLGAQIPHGSKNALTHAAHRRIRQLAQALPLIGESGAVCGLILEQGLIGADAFQQQVEIMVRAVAHPAAMAAL